MANIKDITIRDVHYESYKDAADALDVSGATVTYYVQKGRKDEIGLLPSVHGGYEHPVVVRGRVYESMTACAESLGTTISAVSHAQRRGSLNSLGLRRTADDPLS